MIKTNKSGRYMIDAPKTLRASILDWLRWNKNAVYKHPCPQDQSSPKIYFSGHAHQRRHQRKSDQKKTKRGDLRKSKFGVRMDNRKHFKSCFFIIFL